MYVKVCVHNNNIILIMRERECVTARIQRLIEKVYVHVQTAPDHEWRIPHSNQNTTHLCPIPATQINNVATQCVIHVHTLC